MNIRKIIPYACLTGIVFIILGSFFTFSEIGNPFFNSDDALNVLMAWKFDIPGTLYCWGQDRGGSVIPMLGHILITLLGMSPAWATAIAHYLFNIFGYWGFAQFIKSHPLRLLLAVIWFFPPYPFYMFLLYPMGTQYCLIGIGLLFFNLYQKTDKIAYKTPYFSGFLAALVGSVWASDMALIHIVCLLTTLVYCTYRAKNYRRVFLSWEALLTAASVYLGGRFIAYGKEHATKNESYSTQLFNSPEEILDALGISWRTLKSVFDFTFHLELEWISYYAWTVIILILGFALLFPFRRLTGSFKWPLVFILLNTLAIIATLYGANWVYAYGEMARRYFTTFYISLGILLLYLLDQLSVKQLKVKALYVLTAVSVGAGAYSSLVILIDHDISPKYQQLKALEKISPAGLIGEYWSSFWMAIWNPDEVLATPKEGDVNRNNAITDEVLQKKDIYVIQDNWLEEYPQQMIQYGYKLGKRGTPFELANTTLCLYQRMPYDSLFTIDAFKYEGKIMTDSTGYQYVLSPDTVNMRLFTMGPYFVLGKGKYTVEYQFKYLNHSGYASDTIGVVDATANWGNMVLGRRDILQSDLNAEGITSLQLEFELGNFERDVEFKIWPQFGANDQFEFHGVRLIQREF